MTYAACANLCGPVLGNESKYGLRSLLVLAWPVILARSSQAVIGFCDALMTAPLGEAALTATMTGATNTFALVILPMGVVFIVQSFAAQLYGSGDLVAARRFGWYGLLLSAVTMILAVACIPLVHPVLGLFSYEEEVHRLMTDYLAIRLFAVGAIVATEALGAWYGGLGNTRLHMAVGVLTMIINVALNWLLIEGNLGAPALGVQGAAWASTIASWVGFCVIVWVFHRQMFVDATTEKVRLRWAEFARMLRFGVPNGLNWFVEFAAWTLFINLVVSHLGTTVMAAWMVVISLNSVSFMPAFGLASSGAILVGQAIGEGKKQLVAGIVKRTAGIMVLWQGGVGILYLTIPHVLVSWFAREDQPGLEEVGALLLSISAAWQLFDAIGMTIAETLRAAGDTSWVMWARMIIAWVVFTPASIVLVVLLGAGPVTTIVCVVAYLALLAGLLVYRFCTGAWRDIDLTGKEALFAG